ncbi:pyrrolo-quinoline quinone [Salinadaptatus halalkaliphilus]|uniref:Pyrrolo-quinoline quinone n=1 Tax=Salinadaptatus halalkaliphilus TaxID=2419781 RepID=A0A4S3TN98_9EURY|nr:PQQ-binding-like beta-propeller repeat protein [Salinadaptatus halalkaliphilus]THE65784.1 pyrrolo-quinoline quinone [Salinadaptatus halalkaliphilus]
MTNWNQCQGDAEHSGRRRDREGPREITESWSVDLGGSVGAPVYDRNTVFVGTSRGTLYALEAETGRRRFTVETTAATDVPPAVSRDRVYVGTETGAVVAVDPETGDQIWQTDLPGDHAAGPTLPPSDDRLYVAHDAGVSALETETGDLVWTYETETATVGSPAVADDREWSGPRLFVGTIAETIVGLEAESGEERWTAPADGAVAAGPAVADGRVYVADEGGTLLSLDPDSGQTWFTYQIQGGFTSSPTVCPGDAPTADAGSATDQAEDEEGTTFVGADDGYVHVTDTTFGRRKVRGWLFSKKGIALDGEVRASPVAVGDIACVADTTGSVYGIDAADYDLWWHVGLDGPVTEPPAVGDARLFVPSDDGHLHCLEWTPGDQPSR